MSVVMHHSNKVQPEIHFSESAISHLVAYLAKDPLNKGVRLSVKKTGCSGFSYVIDYVHASEEDDLTTELSGDYVVCIDRKSYPFLKDMQVDYVKEGLNNKFVFTNPNQTGQCGCGESFTVD